MLRQLRPKLPWTQPAGLIGWFLLSSEEEKTTSYLLGVSMGIGWLSASMPGITETESCGLSVVPLGSAYVMSPQAKIVT